MDNSSDEYIKGYIIDNVWINIIYTYNGYYISGNKLKEIYG